MVLFRLFSSSVRSNLGFFSAGPCWWDLLDFFFLEPWSSADFLGGVTAAKTKLLVFFAVVPVLDSLLPLVISANFSKVPLSRVRKEPFLLPLYKRDGKWNPGFRSNFDEIFYWKLQQRFKIKILQIYLVIYCFAENILILKLKHHTILYSFAIKLNS